MMSSSQYLTKVDRGGGGLMYVQAGTRNRTLTLHGLNSVILMLMYIYYTAEQGPSFMHGQSILSGLPIDDNLVSCYPFIGSPDVRIK